MIYTDSFYWYGVRELVGKLFCTDKGHTRVYWTIQKYKLVSAT